MSSGKTICKHGSEPFTCLSCRQNFADEIPLDHPCKNTCSGWKQGYERGKQEHSALLAEKDAEIARLRAALEFYADNKAWFNESIDKDAGNKAKEALAGGKDE